MEGKFSFEVSPVVMTVWQATPQLRFVERQSGVEVRRILQQRWQRLADGVPTGDFEWRDVPYVDEGDG